MSRYRWHLPAAAVFVSLLALAGWDCTGNRSDDSTIAVPRPTGYPRIETYPQSYSDAGFTPLAVETNDSAITGTEHEVRTASGIEWMSVKYPRYNATLYCTYMPTTPGHPVEQTLANREERMALNAGSASSELYGFTNRAGISCRLLITPYGTVTPVQFIATDSTRFVLSGNLHMEALSEAAVTDSIRPVVDAVAADVMHLLENLQPR